MPAPGFADFSSFEYDAPPGNQRIAPGRSAVIAFGPKICANSSGFRAPGSANAGAPKTRKRAATEIFASELMIPAGVSRMKSYTI